MRAPGGYRVASHLAESLPPVHRLAKQIGCESGREALTAGAQIYINFLSLTRRSGWLQGHISKQAERSATKAAQARAALETAAARYLAFMPPLTKGFSPSCKHLSACAMKASCFKWCVLSTCAGYGDEVVAVRAALAHRNQKETRKQGS